MTGSAPYYRGDLALVHDLGFGFHADRCAPGILAIGHVLNYLSDEAAVARAADAMAGALRPGGVLAFVRNQDGCWRRDDERHDNVLVDASQIVGLLRSHGVDVVLGTSFGVEELPTGLVTVVGSARPAARSGSAC